MQLSHERLRVYHAAIEFLAMATKLLETFPRGHSNLVDQFRRAALSIPLNIAEGAGKTSRPDSARFYAIARGSALECGAILDASVVLGLATKQEIQIGKNLLIAVVSMLTKLALKTGV
jgi:four helix bundle protein